MAKAARNAAAIVVVAALLGAAPLASAADERTPAVAPAGTSHESPDFRFSVCPSKSSLARPEMTYPTVS